MRMIFRLIFRISLLAAIFLAGYFVSAFTFPYITSGKAQNNTLDSITIFAVSNGVHTDLVLPAKNKLKDWTPVFPATDFNVKDSLHNFIGFGWGDKGFYLNTPEWSDLKFSTAFNAVFGLGGTAMHVRYMVRPNPNSETCIDLNISEKQYSDLIDFIEKSFKTKNDSVIKIDHPGYGNHDLFYEATGKYNMFKTCNMWTNKALKTIDVKVGFWTPFSKGLMRSLR